MTKAIDFTILLLGAALAGYVLAGGFGLMVTGFVGFLCKGNPFQNPRYGPGSVIQTVAIRKMHEQKSPLPSIKPSHRFFIDLALCFALIVVGFLRLESKGVIGPIGL